MFLGLVKNANYQHCKTICVVKVIRKECAHWNVTCVSKWPLASVRRVEIIVPNSEELTRNRKRVINLIKWVNLSI